MANEDNLDKILAALNAASAKARLTWVTLLLFGTYLAIAVGATTHRDLFLESPVTLPLLDVELPLFTFYIVAPALFVIMHLYLLVHLYLLGRKIRHFEEVLPRQFPVEADQERVRAQLDSFLVLQKLAGRVRSVVPRLLLTLAVWITVIAGPVLLLLAFQVRFLPYHSEAVTWWHRALIALDLVLLWLLWPSTVHASGRFWPALASPFLAFGRLARNTYGSSRQQARRLLDPALPLAAKARALWSWHRGTVAGTQQALAAPLAVASLFLGTVLVLTFSLLVATVPDGYIEREWVRNSGWFAKGDEWYELQDRDGRQIWRPTAYFFEGALDEARPGLKSWFSRSLVLPDADFVPQSEEELAKVERTLTLRDRDLRYAILTGADLRKAEFVVPDLRGARLNFAKLHNARFRCANGGVGRPEDRQAAADSLEASTDGERAAAPPDQCPRLQGASLLRVQLQAASLDRAQLQGASLRGAELQGSSLDDARLQGVSLDLAQLQTASLHSAQLQTASLVGAQLQGVSLVNAQLQGAILQGADLQGAALQGAHLQGASLDRVRLWRSFVYPPTPSAARLLSCRRQIFSPLDSVEVHRLDDFIRAIPGDAVRERARRRLAVLQTNSEEANEDVRERRWKRIGCSDYDPQKSDRDLARFLIAAVACNLDMLTYDSAVGARGILRRMEHERVLSENRPYHALVAEAVLDEDNARCKVVRAALSEQDFARFRSFVREAEPPPGGATPPDGARGPELAGEATRPALVVPAEN